jgi:hypothetical protein
MIPLIPLTEISLSKSAVKIGTAPSSPATFAESDRTTTLASPTVSPGFAGRHGAGRSAPAHGSPGVPASGYSNSR